MSRIREKTNRLSSAAPAFACWAVATAGIAQAATEAVFTEPPEAPTEVDLEVSITP